MSQNTIVEPATVARLTDARTDETTQQHSSVSLVIPARNEAAHIADVLPQIPPSVHEVVLVDGRSRDATVITARSCRPDLRVIAQEGVGKGDALRAGFLATTGDVIVMIDAPRSHQA